MATPEQFAAELLAISVGVTAVAAKAVSGSAKNIKEQARSNVLQTAPVHNGGAYRAINYDPPTISPFGVETEVGYDLRQRAGRLGNLLEYGGGGDHSPPHRDIGRAADAEESSFADAVGDAAWKLFR